MSFKLSSRNPEHPTKCTLLTNLKEHVKEGTWHSALHSNRLVFPCPLVLCADSHTLEYEYYAYKEHQRALVLNTDASTK